MRRVRRWRRGLLGTILGPNEVTASVTGVATQVKFQATGTSGPVTTISISPQNPRLLSGVDSTRLTVQSLDAFGNQTSPPPTLVARDPSLISVAANGVIRVLRRGASTFVVATAGEKSDSVLVTVLATGQSLCTGVAAPLDLAVGQVVTDVSGTGFCVHASTAGHRVRARSVLQLRRPELDALGRRTRLGTGIAHCCRTRTSCCRLSCPKLRFPNLV